jgi:hypothetical protein
MNMEKETAKSGHVITEINQTIKKIYSWIGQYIFTQVLITVYNENMYVNFNYTIAFESLKWVNILIFLKYTFIYV